MHSKVKSSAYLKLALRRVTRQSMDVNVVAEDFNKAEELCPENPDVYFHGAMVNSNYYQFKISVMFCCCTRFFM
jgi:hypothetical protein